MSSSSSSLIHATAGAAAGCCSLAMTYPLFALTLRIQSEAHAKKKMNMEEDEKSISNSTPLSTSSLTALRTILRENGISGLYTGLQAALIAATVQSGVYYFFFQWFRNWHRLTGPTSAFWELMLGFESGAATVFLTNPLWVINARQVTQKKYISHEQPPLHEPKKASFWSVLCEVIKLEGIVGLYSGLLPALALCTAPAIHFWWQALCTPYLLRLKSFIYTYIQSRRGIHTTYTPKLSSMDIFILGAFAKIVATIITYPIQTLKTSLQKSDSQYTGMWSCIIALWHSADHPSSTHSRKSSRTTSANTSTVNTPRGISRGILHKTKSQRELEEVLHKSRSTAYRYPSKWSLYIWIRYIMEHIEPFYRGLNSKLLQTGLTQAFLQMQRDWFLHILTSIATS